MNDMLLRQMDPADCPTPELSDRARADLERILRTDAYTDGSTGTVDLEL